VFRGVCTDAENTAMVPTQGYQSGNTKDFVIAPTQDHQKFTLLFYNFREGNQKEIFVLDSGSDNGSDGFFPV
jgi:hypothetical protein